MNDRHPVRRRAFLGAGLATATASMLGASNAVAGDRASLVAKPPAGFVPSSMPGRVVRVGKSNTLQHNGLWPEQAAATQMLERVMAELTGKADLGRAFADFVHKDDRVAIKPNGIAGRRGATMASNFELVLAIVKGVVAAGVPAKNITIYEQYPKFMKGTRVVDAGGTIDPAFPVGVKTAVHENKDATMDSIQVAGKNTRYCTSFTDATAVIDVGLFKDHGICGYTGALKNVTHGTILNPHDFHEHNASPQIAKLYAQDIVKSRVRLHIADVFKVIYDEGPLDTNPNRRIPQEALYASTDPVALDVIGWALIEKLRRDNSLPTLKDAGREPSYIKVASELGLGVFDKNRITLREVTI